jgi:hypothetical protein
VVVEQGIQPALQPQTHNRADLAADVVNMTLLPMQQVLQELRVKGTRVAIGIYL